MTIMDFYACMNPLCRKIEFRDKGSCYSCGQNIYLHDPTIEELQPKVEDARNILIGLHKGNLSEKLRWNGKPDSTSYHNNPSVEWAKQIIKYLLSNHNYGNFIRANWEELDEKSVRSRITLN